MDSELAVIVAAAGTGSRMGTGLNKQYMLIDGRPVLSYSLDIFEHADVVAEIVVVAQENELEYCKEAVIANRGYKKVTRVIPGGACRQDSVWAGLQHLSDQIGLVAVHDGARPFVSDQLLNMLVKEAKRWGAAIPGRPAYETLKAVDPDLLVTGTLDRSVIWAVQTPQVFHCTNLKKAYREAAREDFTATDDAALYERYIGRVKVVPGDDDNIKITVPEDLKRAEYIINCRKG